MVSPLLEGNPVFPDVTWPLAKKGRRHFLGPRLIRSIINYSVIRKKSLKFVVLIFSALNFFFARV